MKLGAVRDLSPIICATAQDRYERAVWELARAQQEHDEAKRALEGEAYAKEQCDIAHEEEDVGCA